MIFLHIGYRVPQFLALLNNTTKKSVVNLYVWHIHKEGFWSMLSHFNPSMVYHFAKFKILEEVKIILIYLTSNFSTKNIFMLEFKVYKKDRKYPLYKHGST